MEPAPTVRQYLFSAFFLMAAGWGGLVLLIFILQKLGIFKKQS